MKTGQPVFFICPQRYKMLPVVRCTNVDLYMHIKTILTHDHILGRLMSHVTTHTKNAYKNAHLFKLCANKNSYFVMLLSLFKRKPQFTEFTTKISLNCIWYRLWYMFLLFVGIPLIEYNAISFVQKLDTEIISIIQHRRSHWSQTAHRPVLLVKRR